MSCPSIPLDFTAPRPEPRRWSIRPWMFQVVALAPVIWWFVTRLNDGSDEPLGLLTAAFSLAVAWRDRAALGGSEWSRIAGGVLILCSVVGLPWLPPMVRAALGVAGVSLFHGLHGLPGVSGLLLLSLPVVSSMQFYLGYPLRLASAEGAVRMLEMGSLVVSREGTQIDLGGQIVGVDPACSGVKMLWHAVAAAMALSALHRLRWRATVIAGILAVLLVIPVNALRSALLAVKESGHWPGFPLGHEMIGLLGFGLVLIPLWLAISSRARAKLPSSSRGPTGKCAWILLGLAAILAPVLVMACPRADASVPAGDMPSEFSFNGLKLPLEPLPMTDAEISFAGSFPGELANYRWGRDQVILRRVTVATRKLHPSRDCLRASGFQVGESRTVTLADGSVWARFDAFHDGMRWTVHERVTSDCNGSTWTDVSAWFWSAFARPLNGPWQAETILSAK